MKSLEVKLRGRPEAPNWNRGCTLSSSTRGDTKAHHGPLQRLLGGMPARRPTKNVFPIFAFPKIVASNFDELAKEIFP